MRVIVAEDEALLAMDLCDVLCEAGHQVVCEDPSAAEALRCARRFGADLALVNIGLQEGATAGLDLARQLLAELSIPSIFVSGQRADAWRASDVAIGFLPKPYTRADLLGAIAVAETVLGGSRPPPSAIPRTLELFH
jgi:two-component system, response regulator PdtaR